MADAWSNVAAINTRLIRILSCITAVALRPVAMWVNVMARVLCACERSACGAWRPCQRCSQKDVLFVRLSISFLCACVRACARRPRPRKEGGGRERAGGRGAVAGGQGPLLGFATSASLRLLVKQPYSCSSPGEGGRGKLLLQGGGGRES